MYIREAHAADEWRLGDLVTIDRHKTMGDRIAAAQQLVQDYGYKITVFIDSMDDDFCVNYAAWPERYFVISPAGEIRHISSPADELGFNRLSLRQLLLSIVTEAHLGSATAQAADSSAGVTCPLRGDQGGDRRYEALVEGHLVTGAFSGPMAELSGPQFVPRIVTLPNIPL